VVAEPAAAAAAPSAPVRAPAADGVPAPVDVRAERDGDDSSITVTWSAGGAQEVEYKVTRLAPDGVWRVVGRTRTTSIIDGGTAPGARRPDPGVRGRRPGRDGGLGGSAVGGAGSAPVPRRRAGTSSSCTGAPCRRVAARAS
jgi:hypothetical protein